MTSIDWYILFAGFAVFFATWLSLELYGPARVTGFGSWLTSVLWMIAVMVILEVLSR